MAIRRSGLYAEEKGMTREDVIKLAREAGLWPTSSTVDLLERFAALVSAAEREACARVCEAEDGDTPDDQTDCTWSKAARYCAAAIRARGEK